jgi:hypothetical protein
LPIENYNTILGMDWLSRHYTRVNCKRKIVHFCRSGNDILEFKEEKVREENCLILGVRACKLLYKDCEGYLAYLLNKLSVPGKLEEMLVVNEYPDIFPEELTQVLPDREIEFCIDLVPAAEPVSQAPYNGAN